MTDELLYEVQEHVAVITFNRPEQMNTITPVMLNSLSKRLLEADADTEVRAIVITGNGKAWCAGLDIGAAVSGDGIGSEGSSSGTGEFNLRDAPPAPFSSPFAGRSYVYRRPGLFLGPSAVTDDWELFPGGGWIMPQRL